MSLGWGCMGSGAQGGQPVPPVGKRSVTSGGGKECRIRNPEPAASAARIPRLCGGAPTLVGGLETWEPVVSLGLGGGAGNGRGPAVRAEGPGTQGRGKGIRGSSGRVKGSGIQWWGAPGSRPCIAGVPGLRFLHIRDPGPKLETQQCGRAQGPRAGKGLPLGPEGSGWGPADDEVQRTWAPGLGIQ